MASIFSKIISGEIPAITVYEDGDVLAFLDISPASRGHTLVVSKEEFPDIYNMPPETLARVTQAVQRVAIAIRDGIKPDGINIVQNNGAASGQSVFHYHVHLIPRWNGDHVMEPWKIQHFEPGELQTIAETIRQHV